MRRVNWRSVGPASAKIFGLFTEFTKTERNSYFCCWIIWQVWLRQKDGLAFTEPVEYVFLALYSERCSLCSYNEIKHRWTNWASGSGEMNPFRKVAEWGHTDCVLFEDVDIEEFLRCFTSISKAEEGFIRQ